tara:strand:- start:290 stop:523 length:234 start_codon:yes stop_codon:yes gene_type:complete
MNKKYIYQPILVILALIIVYKVLLNFILPIILFVALLSILRGLIKGFDNNQDPETSGVIDNNSDKVISINSEEVKSV